MDFQYINNYLLYISSSKINNKSTIQQIYMQFDVLQYMNYQVVVMQIIRAVEVVLTIHTRTVNMFNLICQSISWKLIVLCLSQYWIEKRDWHAQFMPRIAYS